MAIIVLILIVVIGGSYALFTTTSEGKGALNIVTGDLKTFFESDELDSDNEIVIKPNEVRTIVVNLKNVNSIDAKYNFYYSINKSGADVEVGYLQTGDEAPTTAGYTIGKSGSDLDTKAIKIRILNNEEENVTITFGSSVGLVNDTLEFPSGKSVINKVESNIIQAYTYDDTNEETKCIIGEEKTCVETNCLDSTDANSCPVGTIIRYAVNDTENKYFYVLHDNGTTMTLQQRENTVSNIAWYSEEVTNGDGTTTIADNTKGPLTILPKLEEATSTWTNVNEQEYTAGYTNFYENACTSDENYKITCSINTYNGDSNNLTLEKRKVRARMITAQEASSTGCLAYRSDGENNYNSGTCPEFMHNYLYQSTSNGGSYDDNTTDEKGNYNISYWTMSAESTNSTTARAVHRAGYLYSHGSTDENIGARAVVEINK